MERDFEGQMKVAKQYRRIPKKLLPHVSETFKRFQSGDYEKFKSVDDALAQGRRKGAMIVSAFWDGKHYGGIFIMDKEKANVKRVFTPGRKIWTTMGDEKVCIFQGRAKVITKKGLKEIKEIKIGDYVLTHEDKYRRVIGTSKRPYRGTLVKIKPYGGKGYGKQLVLTTGHPVLVLRENKEMWVESQDIVETDKIMIFAKKCVECGKLTQIWKKFCSFSCVTKHKNRQMWKDPKQHERITEQLKERWKSAEYKKQFKKHRKETLEQKDIEDPEWRKRMLEKMSKTKKLRYETDPDLRARITKCNQEKGKREGWGWKNKERQEKALKKAFQNRGKNHLGKTYIEKKVQWWLETNKYPFKPQYYLRDEIGRMWVDFYLPTHNLVIECDGEYFHNEKDDLKRDIRLANLGYRILRLKGNDIRNNFQSCVDDIQAKCLNGCYIPTKIKKIEKYELNPKQNNRLVYNIELEKGNTFYANNILIHNCPFCKQLDAQIRNADEPFIASWKKGEKVELQYPPAHYINRGPKKGTPTCRCAVLHFEQIQFPEED